MLFPTPARPNTLPAVVRIKYSRKINDDSIRNDYVTLRPRFSRISFILSCSWLVTSLPIIRQHDSDEEEKIERLNRTDIRQMLTCDLFMYISERVTVAQVVDSCFDRAL